jgi:signal transduction histidine kinase
MAQRNSRSTHASGVRSFPPLRLESVFRTPRANTLATRILLPYLRLTLVSAALLVAITVTRLTISGVRAQMEQRLLDASRSAYDILTARGEAVNGALADLAARFDTPQAAVPDVATMTRTAIRGDMDRLAIVDASGQSLRAVETVHGAQPGMVTTTVVSDTPFDSGSPSDLAGRGDGSESGVLAGVVGEAGQMTLRSVRLLGAGGSAVGDISVERLLVEIQQATRTDVLLYAAAGPPQAGTLPGWDSPTALQVLSLNPSQYRDILAMPEEGPMLMKDMQQVMLNGTEYAVATIPAAIEGRSVGVLALLIRNPLPVPLAAATADTTFIAAAWLAIALELVGGFLISVSNTRPIFHRLEEENARTSAILGSIADGVVLRNPEGHIIMANPAAVAMLTGEAGFSPKPLEPIVADADGETDYHQRVEVGERTLDVSVAAVRTPEGAGLGDVLVLRDVTQEALVEKTKDNFLDHVGHELRTPLTVIKGYADVMRLGGDRLRPEVRERAITAILAQTQTLARMIDAVIDLTGMRSVGRNAMHVTRFDLNALTAGAVDDWREELALSGLVPIFRHAPEPLLIDGDEARLRRALDALVHNAARFSPQGGDVLIDTRAASGMAWLRIVDPGVGISEEDLPHIFDRFYRGSPVGADGEPLDVRGVGQGLYAAKTIVEAHGGSIHAESAPGRGSTFSLSLPLAGDDGPD